MRGCRQTAACALGLALWTSAALRSEAQRVYAAHAPDEILIGLKPTASIQSPAMSHAIGMIYGRQNVLHAYRAGVQRGRTVEDTIAELKRSPDVVYAEPNYVLTASITPNDALFGQQWAPLKIQADTAWGVWQPNTPVIVAVVDTGVDSTHPDLANKMLRNAAGAVIGYSAVDKSSNALDDHFHGTHCAGIVAAEGGNSAGVAGIAGWTMGSTNYMQIMPIKVMDSTGSGFTSWAADGVVWAADHGAKIITMSLGGPSDSQALASAIQYAWSKGALIVAAAGNDGVSTKFYPAGDANVLSVAATDSTDTLTSFSNWGGWVSVAAPGANILSTMPGGKYDYLSGTSMACPHAAAEAAMIRAQYPNLSSDALTRLITTQTDAFVPYGSHTLGANAGRINVYKALLAAGGNAVTPPKNSDPPPSSPVQADLQSLAFSASSVAAGGTAAGTVTLTAAAPKGGASIALFSGDAKTAFGTLKVLEGKTTAAFQVPMPYPDKDTPSAFTAKYGTTAKTALLTLKGVSLTAFTLSAATVMGDGTVIGTVTLDHATTNGKSAAVTLTAGSNSVTLPASVAIPAGAVRYSFNVKAANVTANTSVTLSAAMNGGTKMAALAITAKPLPPPMLTGFAFNTNPAASGQMVTGTVTLSSAAGANGVTVTLTSSNKAVPIPPQMTIAAGAKTGTFMLTAPTVTTVTLVTFRATLGNATQSVSFSVKPAGSVGKK